ncbi:LysM peptidoglycan-binding domain-containing protein [Kitasatospora sp. NBC_01266]|uniref:LysM peptidoglycan-binding domain-containing protein n=1 Tax=Kitasatospora sp. NBC_01266 TaxID=2903572 RepID=UPI002E301020|nr:LysM peptidoglycan-binding domain-containing protein [Kitasatospora sp. NBC_01266]
MTRKTTRLPRFDRLRALGRALAAGVALAALVVGLPCALTWCAEPLDLTHVPTWGELSAELTGGVSLFTLMRMLVLVGWALWLLICGQTLYEVAWCVARLPQLLRAGPGEQPPILRVRRTLTGALVISVVLGLLTLLRPTAGSAAASPLTFTAAPVAATASPAPTVKAVRVESNSTNATCEVLPGDTLWDLAERHLGNPLRWKEIYQLNSGRAQGDGSRLADPDTIRPGWIFLLPAAGVVKPEPNAAAPSGPVASRSTQPPAPAAVPPAPPSRPAPKAPLPGPRPPAAAPTAKPAPTTPAAVHAAPPGLELPAGAGYLALSVGIALSAAAVARTLYRRRTYQPGRIGPAGHPKETRPEEATLTASLRRISRLRSGDAASAPLDDTPIGTRAEDFKSSETVVTL